MDIRLIDENECNGNKINLSIANFAPQYVCSCDGLVDYDNTPTDTHPMSRHMSFSADYNKLYVNFFYVRYIIPEHFKVSFLYATKNTKGESILATFFLEDLGIDEVTTVKMNSDQLETFLFDTVDSYAKCLLDTVKGKKYFKVKDGDYYWPAKDFMDCSINGIIKKYNQGLKHSSDQTKAESLYDLRCKYILMTEHGDDPLNPLFPYLISLNYDSTTVRQLKITAINKRFEVEIKTTYISADRILKLIENSQQKLQ